MTNVVIVGAGGLGREILEYAKNASMAVGGFLDDVVAGEVEGHRVLGKVTPGAMSPDRAYVIAVGEPALRRDLSLRLSETKAADPIVHQTAYVSPSARLGQGVVVAPFAFIGPGTVLGAHCLVNVGAVIGHDVALGEYSVVSPGAGLAGGCSLGPGVFVGMNAAVLPKLTVGAGSKVAACAMVTSAVPASSLSVGNPARSRVLFRPWTA